MDYEIPSCSENQAYETNVVAIDPGIKTFMTLYEKDNVVPISNWNTLQLKSLIIYHPRSTHCCGCYHPLKLC